MCNVGDDWWSMSSNPQNPRRFGSNICGEGGEYETLTLDCPLFVHGAIVLDHTEVVMHDGAASAGVAVLHVHQWSVQPKHGNVECGGESGRVVFVPDGAWWMGRIVGHLDVGYCWLCMMTSIHSNASTQTNGFVTHRIYCGSCTSAQAEA